MALSDILRNGIATARAITDDLHVQVTHKAWTGQAFDGTPVYVSKVRRALVEKRQRKVKNNQGEMVDSTTAIYFIEQISPTTAQSAASPRSNPVDPRDLFIYPGGIGGPVSAIDGFYDGGTGVPYYSQVYLG